MVLRAMFLQISGGVFPLRCTIVGGLHGSRIVYQRPAYHATGERHENLVTTANVIAGNLGMRGQLENTIKCDP